MNFIKTSQIPPRLRLLIIQRKKKVGLEDRRIDMFGRRFIFFYSISFYIQYLLECNQTKLCSFFQVQQNLINQSMFVIYSSESRLKSRASSTHKQWSANYVVC